MRTQLPRSIKPPFGPTIDWGNPVNRGLLNCYMFNESSAQALDIANLKNNPAVFGSTGKIGYSAMGAGLRTDDTANGGASISSFVTPSTCSVEALITVYTLDSTVSAIFRTDPSETFAFYIWNDNTFRPYPADSYDVGWASGSPTTGPFAPTVGVPFHVVYFQTSSIAALYVNGTPLGTKASPFVASGTATLNIGFDGFGQNVNMNLSYLKFYNREVTAAEARYLANRPWGFLKPATHVPWVNTIAAAGGTVGVGLTQSLRLGRVRIAA